ncbi:MAG TPA: NTP transferase domain-containing protein [Spirochaetota bacterium]|nr:NTP transferase domain-containing protein [Spirochaetota bacterium]HPJ37878.1 NTP transferase domain-containing protein [Spirochaetota bacterium]HPQ53484.1 NTP transferase domain-containing protein [Spirochaetota bacterium]
MKAIVLAAGTGSRLGELTKTRTKALVPVNGRPLIDYLLDFFDLSFFNEIIVVGGFHYEDIKIHVEKKGISHVKVIENKEYLKGNIYTLITALSTFSEDSFLVTNADHIYPPVMFEKMKPQFQSITAMCDFDRSLAEDDMKVKLYPDSKKIESISKKLDSFDCGYIGMTYVDKSIDNVYRNAIQETLLRFGEKAVVENILQILAENERTAPSIMDLSGIGWYEVDTIEDLMKAEKHLLKDKNFQ